MANAAYAQSPVEIERSVYRETCIEAPDGRASRVIEPASRLQRGDVVVLMLAWKALNRGESFVVTSRVPHDLAFRRSGGEDAEVSVDGGRSWGALDAMRIANRRATPEDVTHLRWNVNRTDTKSVKGMLTYSAIVR